VAKSKTATETATETATDLTVAQSRLPLAPLVRPETQQQKDPQFAAELEAWGVDLDELDEASSDFYPMVDFSRPPEMIMGTYYDQRTGVGPNLSTIYELTDKQGEVFGVWGSTILDQRMKKLNPQRGDWLLIIYVADVPTKLGRNDAKVFRVFRQSAAGSTLADAVAKPGR
jgi:hypothetical protein